MGYLLLRGRLESYLASHSGIIPGGLGAGGICKAKDQTQLAQERQNTYLLYYHSGLKAFFKQFYFVRDNKILSLHFIPVFRTSIQLDSKQF